VPAVRRCSDTAVAMTALTAGMALAACPTAAHTSATSVAASSDVATTPAALNPATTAAKPPASNATASKPQASNAATTQADTQLLPTAGNPNGHVPVPPTGRAVNTSHPTRVIGHGTPASCTSAAVVRAVA
jgi:hypothetical protein